MFDVQRHISRSKERYPEVWRHLERAARRRAACRDGIAKGRFPATPENDIFLLYGSVITISYNRQRNPDKLSCSVPIPPQADVELDDALGESVAICKELASRKRLYLLWSGGIDSTLALHAMHGAGVPFTVLCDNKSAEEYPRLHRQLAQGVLGGVSVKPLDASFYDLIEDPDAWFITGETADQLIGGMDALKLTHGERVQSLADAIGANTLRGIKAVRCSEPSAAFTWNVIEYIFPTMAEVFPGKTLGNTTLGELLWFATFNFKYDQTMFLLTTFGLAGFGEMRNTHHFYNTVKWQQYAMSHYRENTAYERSTEYKLPLKERIYRLNGDEDYYRNKTKMPSLRVSDFWKIEASMAIRNTWLAEGLRL